MRRPSGLVHAVVEDSVPMEVSRKSVGSQCRAEESPIQNHPSVEPCVDGNERAAFAVMNVCLRMNGHDLEVDDVEGHAFLVGLLERGRLELAAIDAGLRGHVGPPR